MEDAVISGDDICLGKLAGLGGGEKGLRYVCLNRAARQKRADAATGTADDSLPGSADQWRKFTSKATTLAALLVEAAAAVRAMTPEQQEAMFREQQKSWARQDKD